MKGRVLLATSLRPQAYAGPGGRMTLEQFALLCSVAASREKDTELTGNPAGVSLPC